MLKRLSLLTVGATFARLKRKRLQHTPQDGPLATTLQLVVMGLQALLHRHIVKKLARPSKVELKPLSIFKKLVMQ